MYPTTRRTRRRLTGAIVAATLLLVACGDDDDASSDDTTTTTEAAAVTTAPPDDGPETITVTGVDYGFQGVPAQLDVGTELAFTNASDVEVHEIVLLKVNDDETRSVDEILQLPEAERDAVAAFRGVTVAFPGEDAAFTDGSMTLDEPGRYVLICTIPQGADPAAYQAAVADPEAEGPPDVAGGPPHLVLGMVSEVTVG